MNGKIKRILSVLLVLTIVVTAAVGCGKKEDKGTIKVGSKNFTENLILAEIYALALEDNGYKVDRVFNVASSAVHTSIVKGDIELYPEYTGTGLLSVLKLPLETDAQKVYDTVKKEYKKKYNIDWLDYAAANDSQGVVIRTAVAKKYGIKTITDLQKYATKLRFASQGEFDKREDGLPAMEKAYGKFEWKSTNVYDTGLLFQILEQNKADVAPAYTTAGQLKETDKFTILTDDKHIWPPYNIAPIVKDKVLKKYPEIKTILNKVNKQLDNKTIVELNAKVDIDKQEYEDVAKDFYDSIKDKIK